ncbi:hypothetical protein BDV95DRAFT_558721 [Massariosphaeria phaeospora]|uniref:RING-type domain-containing protein n=1 Tax=Massariosphaeria phaeospora TaxID=100035 RepID=A0A7C8IHE2_9PLEO|nr:hypothetical protein BDV95DRAFT_558721 [Massariosphaeria phaeospora]
MNLSDPRNKTCDCCPEPRTFNQWRKKHLRLVPVPIDDPECPICREPYGERSLVNGMLDTPYQMVGLSNCSHVFGKACLYAMIQAGKGWNNCPLCRGQWFQDAKGLPTDPEPLRIEAAELVASVTSVDIATARYWIYREPEWKDRAQLMLMDWMERHNDATKLMIKTTNTEMVSGLLVKLANWLPPLDHCPISSSGMYTGDPLTFKYWQLPPQFVRHPLLDSWFSPNGQRLHDMFRARIAAALPPHNLSRDSQAVIDDVILQSVEFYGSQDVLITRVYTLGLNTSSSHGLLPRTPILGTFEHCLGDYSF